MAPRFGRLATLFGRRFFDRFRFEPGDDDRLRALEQKGAVVYVMRYSSRLDYFLFNWLFLLSGVRLSAFANGIKFFYYRPFGEALRLLFQGIGERLRRGARGMREQSIQQIRQVVREGGSAFLFLRTDKIRTRVHRRRRAVREGRTELDYLREVVDTGFANDVPISLVPLALFWRKGARPQRPFLNLFYGANERPTDLGKMAAFLWNYHNLAVRVGTPIDLRAFIDQNRASGRERVVKQVRRSLLIFLRREEKPVVGAALPSFARVQEAVLDDGEVQRVVDEVAREKRRPSARVEARAQKNLAEIAASPSPTMLAVLASLVEWIFKRIFARIELHDLEPVVEAAKLHPLVLVPSHRSHFDYLILSWLFYRNHLVPPQVAAGINLAFFPLGAIFRRAGAFFLRRSFDGDPLYTAVFRSYVQHLIKDGVTQEFFIEGTRSRTGKTLRPRLGMLRMVLEAYARGARRDLYLVPVGFTYERLVEESSVAAERGGAKKQRETLFALFGASRVLRLRYGSVTVRFGAPISLAKRLGGEFPKRLGPGRIPDLRGTSGELGVELCRAINDLVTAGRSTLAATALLGQTADALREDELRERVVEVASLLELLGVPRDTALSRCLETGRPEAVVELLELAGRVRRVAARRSPAGGRGHAPGARPLPRRGRARAGLAGRARALAARAADPGRATQRCVGLARSPRRGVLPGRGRGARSAARSRARPPGDPRLGRAGGRRAARDAGRRALARVPARAAAAAARGLRRGRARGCGDQGVGAARGPDRARPRGAARGAAHRRGPLPRGGLRGRGRKCARAAAAAEGDRRRRQPAPRRDRLRARAGLRGARAAVRAAGSGARGRIESRAWRWARSGRRKARRCCASAFPRARSRR